VLHILNNFNITAIFSFDKEVTYNGVASKEHSYIGKSVSQTFDFESKVEFQLLDVVINGNSVKEHIEHSVNFFDFVQDLTKDSFAKTQKKLKIYVHESDWICVMGPFSRWKIAGDPTSGHSDTFYYITWFGHARPGTNMLISGQQLITHNQKLLDKWVLQKRMWGTVGESRARVFFVPPFEYKDQ
jgi:hypothetical protein